MRVFISWSGEPSRSIARALRDWLPNVVQHVDPWMSDEEIKSGTRWNDKVAEALDGTDFGLICLTASNQHKPWLMFEAGALAKRLALAQLVPLCVDLALSEITGPLETFQARRLDHEGMRRVVGDLMSLRDKPPALTQTDAIFRAMWPSLEVKIAEAKRQGPITESAERSPEEMLKELVERIRRIDRTQTQEIYGSRGVRISDGEHRLHVVRRSARRTEPLAALGDMELPSTIEGAVGSEILDQMINQPVADQPIDQRKPPEPS